MSKRKTNKEFVVEAREIYHDKYDYSKCLYKNAHTKVCVNCKEHGDFFVSPTNHLRGRGCPKCASKRVGELQRSSVDEFIASAKRIHKERYDYSMVQYIDSKTKVKIICPIHGEFWQKPSNHLSDQGCPICGAQNRILTHRKTKESFTSEVSKIFGNKYDYSKMNYIDRITKVCIICPDHGEFWQTPSNHLSGHGCPKCANDKISKTNRLSIEDFIKRSNIVHNHKYDYNRVEYINGQTKVCIVCPKHGSTIKHRRVIYKVVGVQNANAPN